MINPAILGRLLLVFILGLLIFNTASAHAAPWHRPQQHRGHQRHFAVSGHRRALPLRNARNNKIRIFEQNRNSTAPDLIEAERFLGRSNPTPYREEWCRDFINLVAGHLGIHLANQSHRAIDSLGLGPHVRQPRPGDLAVVGRHHVTIVAAVVGRKFIGLGGNQSHRVKYSQYSMRSVIAFVRI